MAPTLYQIWSQILNFFFFFWSKSSKILCGANLIIMFKFHQHVVQILIKEWRDLRLPISASAIDNIKYPFGTSIFASKFDGKHVKPLPCYRCWCWHLKSKVAPYIPQKIFCTTYWWNLNRIVWYILHFISEFFFDEKLRFFKTIFHKVLVPFWKRFFFLFVFVLFLFLFSFSFFFLSF